MSSNMKEDPLPRSKPQKYRTTCPKCKRTDVTTLGYGQYKYCPQDGSELTLEPVVGCAICEITWLHGGGIFHKQMLCKEHLELAQKIEAFIQGDSPKAG